jgi:hypothetical protein
MSRLPVKRSSTSGLVGLTRSRAYMYRVGAGCEDMLGCKVADLELLLGLNRTQGVRIRSLGR